MGVCSSSSSDSFDPNDNLENFSIVWLKNPLAKKLKPNESCRQIVNYLQSFTNENQCQEYFDEMSSNEFCFLIIDDEINEEFVRKIHSYSQILSIYIYSKTKTIDRPWINQLDKVKFQIFFFVFKCFFSNSKIKSICMNPSELYKQIELDHDQFDYLRIPFGFDVFDPEQTNYQFFYSQIFIHVLLEMDALSTDRDQLIGHCRNQYRTNRNHLNNLENFEENYLSNDSIHWLSECRFLGEIFSKAWRKQQFDLIFLFRFFLHDIEQQLIENPCLTPIKVYAIQFLSKEDFHLCQNSVHKFISINTFLFTNSDRNLVIERAKKYCHCKENLQSVLFEINAEFKPNQTHQFGIVPSTNEILFMFGSIFSLDSIQQIDEHLWTIELTRADQSNASLRSHFEEYETNFEINLLSFGIILQKMKLDNETENYYQRLFRELPDDDEQLAYCSLNLGNLALLKSNYELSLEWLLKSLDISLRLFQSNDPLLALIYRSLSQIYYGKNQWQSAIEYLEKSIIIWKQSIEENFLDVAQCLNQIGVIYKINQEYPVALDYFKQTLHILEKYLVKNHIEFTKIYSNLASIYRYIQDYDHALEYAQLTLKILEEFYSTNQLNLAKANGNLGIIYALKGDNEQALIHYSKASTIYQEHLPLTHINNLKLEQLIRDISTPNRKISFGIVD